ncbi:MAG: tRNA (mnm(5)s(2)U34)-methyltransferase [Faecalibacillus sp.]
MESMTEFVQTRIKKKTYHHGIDFTMGNGHDTLFLSEYCQHVYSYDIQKIALQKTQELVKDKNNISLFLKSHEFFDEDVNTFDVGIFNLGYLPGGNHQITTKYQTTIKTIEKALSFLSVHGCLYIVVYVGHDNGEESLYLNSYFQTLDHKLYNVAKFEMMNKNNAPYVIIVEKR